MPDQNSAADLAAAISKFGAAAKAKLSNPAAHGAPEDQLRAPLEALIEDICGLIGLAAHEAVLVGESSLAELKTRPDYAATRKKALIGFIEVKAPGKGANPKNFTDSHDKDQWDKLKSLPNLIYTDGNGFSLWRKTIPQSAHAQRPAGRAKARPALHLENCGASGHRRCQRRQCRICFTFSNQAFDQL